MPQEQLPPLLSDFQGRRVTVMGLGTFGGGVGAVRFLLDRGAHVTITDLRSEVELAASLKELDDDARLTLHLGRHPLADFQIADLVVVNPAVPADNRFLTIARNAGVPLTSEMNLFWQHNPGKVLAVTGSNGKSTTTSMIFTILQATGRRCWLGGNIGRSLLPQVDDIQPDDWVVLELSSFQLEDLNRIAAAPDVAVVTNFSPNHLDRHGDMDHYRAAKQTVLRWQQPQQVAVLNADDDDIVGWESRGQRLEFGTHDAGQPGAFVQDGNRVVVRIDDVQQTIPLQDWLKLPGTHNLQNALAAVAATVQAGAGLGDIQQGLESFEGLPHRLQFVAQSAGRRFYNDSKATTPESAILGLQSFDDPVVLLAGGYDKQVNLDELARAIANKTKAVALMGQTANRLAEVIRSQGQIPELQICLSFEEAFAWAMTHSEIGDVVLLSPGCASYDWFTSFTERGDRFIELAQTWQG